MDKNEVWETCLNSDCVRYRKSEINIGRFFSFQALPIIFGVENNTLCGYCKHFRRMDLYETENQNKVTGG